MKKEAVFLPETGLFWSPRSPFYRPDAIYVKKHTNYAVLIFLRTESVTIKLYSCISLKNMLHYSKIDKAKKS